MIYWRIFITKWKYCTVILIITFTALNLLSWLGDGNSNGETKIHELTKEDYQRLINIARVNNIERIANVARTCEKYNLGLYKNGAISTTVFKEPPTPQYEVFYFDKKHKLSWCPIYKAASSSWLYNFALLAGYSEEDIKTSKKQLSALVREKFPYLEFAEAEEILHNSLKFMVVRHPFERILSAYRDKLENLRVRGIDGTYHFYRSYGQKIVNKYRPGGNRTNVRDILRPDQYHWNTDEQEPIGIEPTFKEFVRYLISADLINRADDHWIPYHLYCTPCLLKYEVIAKVETMFQDQLYIIHSAGIENISPQWRHKTNFLIDNDTVPANYDVSKLAKIYFSQLSEQELTKLYKVYRLDFELFQYSPQAYYKYCDRY